jgi:hypothetical protein
MKLEFSMLMFNVRVLFGCRALLEIATVDPAQVPLGPRYAPDDPTFPNPWKGLIDRSTGVFYYWNPEKNVTQYEKPASLTPPILVGIPDSEERC